MKVRWTFSDKQNLKEFVISRSEVKRTFVQRKIISDGTFKDTGKNQEQQKG